MTKQIPRPRHLPATLLLLSMMSAACSEPAAPVSELDADILAATGGEPSPRAVALENYQQVLDLFDELEYTPEAWQAGIREVPRVYLAEINDRWARVTTKEIDVTLKKRLFFRAMGPLALRSNELILADRQRLLDGDDGAWLEQLAGDYGLDTGDYDNADELREALLSRVDIVPPSLVLAQAAEESGWGTSRFAFTGNALFGQWTWGDNGIRPEQQRESRGDYKIAAFDAPLQSVQAHARNLNTHRAYAEFRRMRAEMRAENRRLSGNELAATLTSYSERGAEYVKSLRSIMSYNTLDPADDAYLRDSQAIVLVESDTATD